MALLLPVILSAITLGPWAGAGIALLASLILGLYALLQGYPPASITQTAVLWGAAFFTGIAQRSQKDTVSWA